VERIPDPFEEDGDELMVSRSFDAFMAGEMTRLISAQIPAGAIEGALKVLLRAAFESGRACGQGEISVKMLRRLNKLDTERERKR
jgi:hypothetical protein